MKTSIEWIIFTERVINAALRKALRERDATRAIDVFLSYIGQKFECERIYIFEGIRGISVSNTFEWCAEGVSAQIDNLQDVPFDAVAWWYESFDEKGSITIPDIEEIKESEPKTYEYLKPQNIQSLIAAPLVLEGNTIGFYGMDNPPSDIMENMSNVAEMIGHFLVSLLEKRRLLKQLAKLSFEDSLSSVMNRHALHQHMESKDVMFDVGVVYCDLMGLKRVNDTFGHQAGDKLIVRASDCLKAVFRRTDIYRIGGDEFLVFCTGITEDIFKNKVDELRKEMKKAHAFMAIGYVWEAEVTDVDAMISHADKLMYQEKQAHYSSHKALH